MFGLMLQVLRWRWKQRITPVQSARDDYSAIVALAPTFGPGFGQVGLTPPGKEAPTGKDWTSWQLRGWRPLDLALQHFYRFFFVPSFEALLEPWRSTTTISFFSAAPPYTTGYSENPCPFFRARASRCILHTLTDSNSQASADNGRPSPAVFQALRRPCPPTEYDVPCYHPIPARSPARCRRIAWTGPNVLSLQQQGDAM
ncbi:hypothetical protein CLIM01_10983 [Colletotrichum limetticola]|uniref:Uncharacterized protein n=1 Tax=Colletotrichum limetticola TaxID=1209924 RepID=A0ABQ9PJA4_9PEZI|nr:hypothetical protein CLIM01_10983 [Colletotrichum limetticola]